jgi:hypothetical protein
MSNQLLFYTAATPVNLQRHRDWGVESTGDFSFAANTNSAPVMAVEFAKAAAEYTLIFAGEGKKVVPSAVLGIQNDSNLYVDSNGKWASKYIPAFVRRYPFVFSSGDEGKTFTLCIDEDYAGLNKKAEGNRLFGADGERTDYLNGVLNFLKEYQTEYNRTQLFCDKLVELELLEPMQAQIKLKSGKQLSLTGFQSVSREKLNALAPETLSELAKTGALELIYIHLYSMKNFSEMMERVSVSLQEKEMAASEKQKASSLEDLEPAGTA